ncbi:MAG TPA: MBOAT family O-acyltransferase [Candidatus Binatia bacterium]|nr:MBOAT family O-acyltransferase [Candidatus Binatia bacterium]
MTQPFDVPSAAPDLLHGALLPFHERLQAGIVALGMPAAGASAAVDLLGVVELALLAIVLAQLAPALRNAQTSAPGRAGAAGGSALVATALFLWILRHPSREIHELFLRWDHLAFAVAAGTAVAALPSRGRKWVLSTVSAVLLVQYSGPVAVAVIGGAGLIGFAALIPPWARRPRVATVLQGGLVVAVLGLGFALRATHPLQALQVQGLAFFLLLRHVSYAVEVCRGAPASLADYACYLSFYPGAGGALGAPEVYAEFARRNLSTTPPFDDRLAVQRIAVGALEVWVACRIMLPPELLLASSTAPVLWYRSLRLFVCVALYAMGSWAALEGTALFLGMRLRPNFTRLLTCRNPSDLWRSWRGTMTFWLIHHIYAPLGGGRHRQERNILAAFAASLVWHWIGVPFLARDLRLEIFAPITLWAILNAAAVVAHVRVQRRGWRVLPAWVPARVREALKIALMLVLASFSVTLPVLQLAGTGALRRYFLVLVGLSAG